MCDTIVSASEHRVLAAKNSDRDPNEAQLLEWHPGAAHPPGARIRWSAAVGRAVGDDVRPAWVRSYWHKRDHRAGVPARAHTFARPAHHPVM